MISDIFYWILNLSILGSLAGFIIMLIRRIRFFPRFAIYVLWFLPLVRFWIPIGMAYEYSLLNLISRYTTKTIIVWKTLLKTPEFTMTNSIQAAQSYFPIVYKTELLQDIFTIAGIIWLVILIVILLCSIVLYIFTKSKLKNALHIKDNIYHSNDILSPLVYGVFKPKIILPCDVQNENLEYILQHEFVHIRRHDNLWRVIAITTACVHWFNPLSWIFLNFFFDDMELACDSGVLKKITVVNKKKYASILLDFAPKKTYYISSFSGTKTKQRIENILSYKKLTLFSGLCFMILFLTIVVTVITNAVGR